MVSIKVEPSVDEPIEHWSCAFGFRIALHLRPPILTPDEFDASNQMCFAKDFMFTRGPRRSGMGDGGWIDR